MRPEIKHIFQVFISDNGEFSRPSPISENILCLQSLYPDVSYTLFKNEDLVSLIGSHFSSDVLMAYQTLVPFTYRADLARFCILYLFGGLYVDLGCRLFEPIEVRPRSVIAVHADYGPNSAPWGVVSGITYAEPRQPEFRTAIDMIVNNVKTRYYGSNCLAPTGPLLLGRALAACNRLEKYSIGKFGALFDMNGRQHLYFQDYKGCVFAVRANTFTSVATTSFVTGINNYPRIWRRRQIYGEVSTHFGPELFSFSDSGRGTDGTAYELLPFVGIQLFGPYVEMDAGIYRADVLFAHNNINGFPVFDVCYDYGRQLFVTPPLPPTVISLDDKLSAQGFTFSFQVPHFVSNLEIRLHNDGNFAGRFLGVIISDS